MKSLIQLLVKNYRQCYFFRSIFVALFVYLRNVYKIKKEYDLRKIKKGGIDSYKYVANPFFGF